MKDVDAFLLGEYLLVLAPGAQAFALFVGCSSRDPNGFAVAQFTAREGERTAGS